MEDFFELFRQWNTTAIVLRLFLAVLVGGIIGTDREYRNKGAGLKTHVMVCIGAAVAMIVNEYVLRMFPDSNTDLTRIGSQVISGIGFLGAGTIIVTGRNEVKGLTTAAGLWACACAGLCAGVGFAEGTLIALAFIFLSLKLLKPIDKALHRTSKFYDMYAEFEDGTSIRSFIKEMRANGWDVIDMSLTKSGSFGGHVGTLTVHLDRHGQKDRLKEILKEMPGLIFYEEL